MPTTSKSSIASVAARNRFMSLFSRHVCRYFVTYFTASLGICTALFLVVEVFDHIDEFIERRVLWYDAARYLLFKLPGILYQMAPAGCLLASVLTFSTLSKHNEIVAIRAAGRSPLSLVLPLAVPGGVVFIVMLLAQAYVVPHTNHTANLIWRARVRHAKIALGQGLFQHGHIWYRRGKRIWSIERGLPLQQLFLGVTIFEIDTTGRIRQRYDAAEARWDAGGWSLHNGQRRAFDQRGHFAGNPEAFAMRRVDFAERPEDIGAVGKEADEMSLQESLAQARRLQKEGVPDHQHWVAFHGKVAFASVGALMSFFGLPLSLLSNRHGGRIRAVALTLAAGFGYWILHSFAIALGVNGQLPPLLAAWSANGCFAAGSVAMAWRVR